MRSSRAATWTRAQGRNVPERPDAASSWGTQNTVASRSQRFSDAISTVAVAREQIDELREELQNWLDNMPENLQSSSKADALQEAIDALENIVASLEEVEGETVDFPGMMG